MPSTTKYLRTCTVFLEYKSPVLRNQENNSLNSNITDQKNLKFLTT